MTLVLAFNWADGLQTAVPGYTSALQRTIEGSSYAKKQLDALKGTAGGQRWPHCYTGDGPRALRAGARLQGHHDMAQHAGRRAAHVGVAQGQGRPRRLLDLLLHQLPAIAPPCRGLVQPLPRRRDSR